MNTHTFSLICAAVALLATAQAEAQVTLQSAETAVPTCGSDEAWFAGGCRDGSWVLSTFGAMDSAFGSPTERANSSLQLVHGFSDDEARITFVSSIEVKSGEPEGKTAPLEFLAEQLLPAKPAVPSKEGPTAAEKEDEAGLVPQFEAPRVDPEAVEGGFLVNRTVDMTTIREGNDLSVQVVERQIDLLAPGGPRLVEVQRFEFNPSAQRLVCSEGALCSTAYLATPLDCLDELLAYAAAHAEYVASWATADAQRIEDSGYRAAQAYRAYADCIIYN